MANWKYAGDLLLRKKTLLWVYILLAVIASIQQVSLETHPFAVRANNSYASDLAYSPAILKQATGQYYTNYNNYIIFKRSYFHLLNGVNLYAFYPREQWDLFKYSPTFALFMGIFAYLPDILGLSLWNILNALVLLGALTMLPFKEKKISLILWFILIELLTSLQNAQSNALLAGLIVGAFACMERGKMAWAALWLVLATYIKIYGAIGFCLFLMYPDKIRFVLYALLWTLVVTLLPLVVVSPHTLVWQYQNWAQMMGADLSSSYGLSVMGWLHSWFGLDRGKFMVLLVGVVLLFLPFLRWRQYRNETYRLLILAGILIWVIIFNHKAESPTFIIAATGVAIWYFSRPAQPWRTGVLVLFFLFTCLSATDLFPGFVREHFLLPYKIKVVPCIMVWCCIVVELMRMPYSEAAYQSSGVPGSRPG